MMVGHNVILVDYLEKMSFEKLWSFFTFFKKSHFKIWTKEVYFINYVHKNSCS